MLLYAINGNMQNVKFIYVPRRKWEALFALLIIKEAECRHIIQTSDKSILVRGWPIFKPDVYN